MNLHSVTMAVVCALSTTAWAGRKVVAVNEDNDHYFKQDASLMTQAALEAYVDGLAGGKVTHFLMCPSGQRPSYGSKAWEPIWTGLDEPDGLNRGVHTTWAKNAKALFDRGIDPYQVWIRRCRLRGISPWLSPRMNDAHNSNQRNPFRSTNFWREHDELHCEPGYRGKDWSRATLNFALQPVQDYTFALIREQLDRYDIDGYELDFMRFQDHFPRGTGAANTHHLDRFVQRVRKYADGKERERGHRIRLGVRVAVTPEIARLKGCDVATWVRSGWVDWVCASTQWETPDYNLPVAEWRACFGDRADSVTLLAGTDHGVNSSRKTVRHDMAMRYYAGFADVQWGNGVDGLYLFNLPYLPEELSAVARLGLWPEDLPGQLRTYPVSFRADARWGGASEDLQLPRKTDRPFTLRLRLGAKPEGRVSVLVGVEEPGEFAPVVSLNGFPSVDDAAEIMEVRPTGVRHKGLTFTCRRYWFPENAVHGGPDNLVSIAATPEPKTVQWCELQLEPLSTYAVGADVSWVTEMERNGAVFKTAEGEPRDCFDLMCDYGLTAARLRVWVAPGDGWCNLADTVRKARRAKAAGLDLMIDFHYSDRWADPGVQQLPKAWEGKSVDELCRAVANHTREVLTALREEGISPKWVQVGNETTFGMFWTVKKDERGRAKWIDRGGERGWEPDLMISVASTLDRPENYARIFQAGYDAVKSVCPAAKVLVHLSSGEKFALTESNLGILRKYGATWDMVGISVYPPADRAKAAEMIAQVVTNIRKGFARWHTPYMVVETGVNVNADDAASVENARQIVVELARKVRDRTDGACRGLFFWEPECTPKMYGKGAFTSDHRPTAIMTALTPGQPRE